MCRGAGVWVALVVKDAVYNGPGVHVCASGLGAVPMFMLVTCAKHPIAIKTPILHMLEVVGTGVVLAFLKSTLVA